MISNENEIDILINMNKGNKSIFKSQYRNKY
jgi:hypothetical protein